MKDLLLKEVSNPLLDLNHALCTLSPLTLTKLEQELLRGTPFAYLLGNSEFYYSDFYVNPSVLIPRPETEYLVDLIVQESKGKCGTILDVGTGSGVILLSLLKNGVGESGVGVDSSSDALEVARLNARRLKLESRATFQSGDRLRGLEEKFDLIVSNPPYIKYLSQRKLVHEQVDNHEPHEALYLPDAEYSSWFEDFFSQVKSLLKGVFWMEGHELEVDHQARQLKALGFQNVQVLQDLTGTKRFLKAHI